MIKTSPFRVIIILSLSVIYIFLVFRTISISTTWSFCLECLLQSVRNDSVVQVYDSSISTTTERSLSSSGNTSRFVSSDSEIICHGNRTDYIPLVPVERNFPIIIREYVSWHNVERACLENVTCMSSRVVPVLVSRCHKHPFCLGLGDRAQSVYFAFLFAIASKRVFLMKWPDVPFDVTAGMIPASVDWRVPRTITDVSKWPELHWGPCSQGANCMQNGQFDPERMPLPDTAGTLNLLKDNLQNRLSQYKYLSLVTRYNAFETGFLLQNENFNGAFQELNQWNNMIWDERHVLRTLFRPSHLTLSLMRNFDFGKSVRYIGVHLRTGEETLEHAEDRFKNVANTSVEIIGEHVIRCADKILLNKPFRKLFLASDSARMKRHLPSLGSAWNIEVQSMGIDPVMHVDTYRMHNFGNESSKDCKRFLGVFVDVFMLAGSDMIIALNKSYFSDLAKSLSSKSTWFTQLDNRDINEACRPFPEYRV